MKLSELKKNSRNPRVIKDAKFALLKKSIQEFPEMMALRPIVIDEGGMVLGGNMRLEALRALKFKEIPDEWVKQAHELSEEQKREFIVKDNAGFGEWNFDELANEWRDLPLAEWGLDLPEEWSSTEELPVVEDEAAAAAMIDRAGELQKKWEVKRGDLWQIGEHRLLCEDSTSREEVERLMAGKRAQMVLSDPPYGMDLDTDWSGAIGSLNSIGRLHQTAGKTYDRVVGDDIPFDPSHIFELFGYCAEIFLFGADYYAERLPDKNAGSWLVWDKRKESQSEAIGSEFELCWSKKRHKRRMLRHDWFGFLSSANSQEARSRVHPNQKPTSLLRDIMQQWGERGDIVFEGYLGSGSLLEAAEQIDHICYGMEIEPKYCAVTLERLSALGLNPQLQKQNSKR